MTLTNAHNFILFDYHSFKTDEEGDGTVLIAYKGSVTHLVLGEISQTVKQYLTKSPQINRKIFSIFIELAQNIAYYSYERNYIGSEQYGSGIGTVIIKEFSTYYQIISGNIVTNEDAAKIFVKSQTVNSLDREGLREFKRRMRGDGDNLQKGNIGLIQIALTAKSLLDVKITPLTDKHSFFSLSVNVQKSYDASNDDD
jgi:hypothetical protein